MEATDRVSFLFADARALYDNALEMLAQGKRRNAAEKAWGATKRATDALVLAREEGGEPQSAGQARRALLRMSTGDPAVGTLQGEYHLRARMLHIDCFYKGNCEPEQEMAGLIRPPSRTSRPPRTCPPQWSHHNQDRRKDETEAQDSASRAGCEEDTTVAQPTWLSTVKAAVRKWAGSR